MSSTPTDDLQQGGATWPKLLQAFALSPGGSDHIRLAVTPADRQRAIDSPTLGGSSFERIHSMPRGRPLRNPEFNTDVLVNMGPETEFARERRVDISSRALMVSGATLAPSSDFWVLQEDGTRCTPLVNLDFSVYERPHRPTRTRPIAKGQLGVRLGPGASGAMTLWVTNPKSMPPAVRKPPPPPPGDSEPSPQSANAPLPTDYER